VLYNNTKDVSSIVETIYSSLFITIGKLVNLLKLWIVLMMIVRLFTVIRKYHETSLEIQRVV